MIMLTGLIRKLIIRKLICREPETLVMVVGAIRSRIRYGRMGFLKMSGTPRFMRLLLVYSRTTNPDFGRFKTPAMEACIWRQEKRSKQPTQRSGCLSDFAPEVADAVHGISSF